MTSLNYVQITGTFRDGSNSPLSGSVKFIPSQTVYASGVPLATPDSPVTAEITNGQLESLAGGGVQLLATDNESLSVQGRTGWWYWTVEITITSAGGTVTDQWDFFLPYSADPVDLYSLAGSGFMAFANPMTQALDLIIGGTGGTPERLASPGGTTDYLRADGTWDAPPGTGGGVTSFNSRTGAITPQDGDYSSFYDAAGAAAAAQANAEGYAASLLPFTTLGDSLYGGAGGIPTRLAGNTTATRKFWRQTGTGLASAAPAWDTLQAEDIPALAYTAQLARTTVQTSNYTASANQIVPVDTTSGSVTVTLPNAPAAGTVVSVKQVTLGTGNSVTVACAGSDVFNKTGGGTTGTLMLLSQGMLLHYNGSGIWTVLSDDLPLSQTDARYARVGAGRTVTLVVAASNASAAWKAVADYTCTGSNDDVIISEATAALPSGGGTVLLSEGTFSLGNSATITQSGTRLIGSGPGTLVKITGAVSGLHIISANPSGSVSSVLTGIYVADLTVMGYGDNGNSGPLAHGVNLNWCNDSTVQNIWGHDVTWAVVNLNNCQRAVVDRIHIESGTLGATGGWYGVAASNTGISGYYAGHVITNVVSEAPHHAVAMESVSHALVSGVTAMNMTDSGGDPYVLNWQGCDHIHSTGIIGINVPGLYFLEISQGVEPVVGCDSCTLDGFMVTVQQSTGRAPVYVSDSTNCKVSNGFINATGMQAGNDGVEFSTDDAGIGSPYGAVRNVTVINPPRYGVNMAATYATDYEVSGCTVMAPGSTGIVAGADNGRVTNNHVENGLAAGMLVGGHNCQVTGNIVKGNAGNGIYTGTGSYSLIDGNALLSNGGYGILVASGSTNVTIGMGNAYASNTSGTISDSGTGTVRNDTRFATLASPALTGTPTAPTAPQGTNTTQLATTAFVEAAEPGWVPADNGLLMATYDPATATVNVTPTAGTLYLIKLTARYALTLSNLWFAVTTVGSGTSTGSYVGLYNSSGSKLIGSSDISASFATATPTACALSSSQAVAAGAFVWAALLLNIATMPVLAKGVGNNGLVTNLGLSASAYRWAVNGTGLTSLPSSITPSSNASTTATLWCGAS